MTISLYFSKQQTPSLNQTISLLHSMRYPLLVRYSFPRNDIGMRTSSEIPL